LDFYVPWRLSMYLITEMTRRWHSQMVARAPGRLLVPTVLFRSGDYPIGTSADLGWQSLCPNISVVPVGGGHTTMFDPPYLAPLSEEFAQSVLRFAEEPVQETA